jgi:UTP--glucose-1-phosphate uridylyltransferase
MLDVYACFGRSVLAAMPVPEQDYPKYGMIKTSGRVGERVYRVEDVIEKPAIAESPSNLAQVKAYILTPDIFYFLERTRPSQGGEIWLADALRELLKHEVAYAYEFDGQRYDAGSVLEYLKANVDLALQRPEYREQMMAHLRAVVAQADSAEPSMAGRRRVADSRVPVTAH